MKRLSPTQEAMLRDMVEDPSLDFSVNGPVQSTLQALRRLNYVWGYEVTDEGRAVIKALDANQGARGRGAKGNS